MLSVIIMEVLNSLIREADSRSARTHSAVWSRVFTHRASLYADDLVVLVAPVANDMHCLSEILRVCLVRC